MSQQQTIHPARYFLPSTMDDDLDLEAYFANYVPLSNLPTPPPTTPRAPPPDSSQSLFPPAIHGTSPRAPAPQTS